MIWRGPTVKIGSLLIQDEPHFIDDLTWRIAYKRGYLEPRYPVPAIRIEVDFHFEEVTLWSPYGGDAIGNYIWKCQKIWSNDALSSD